MRLITNNHSRALQVYPLLLVLGAALLFRFLLVGALSWDDVVIDSYDQIAINLLDGKGFSYNGTDPTVARAPLYPTYVAAVFLVCGGRCLEWLRVGNIILDSLTSALIVLAFSAWFPRAAKGTAVIAGFLYALNPFSAYYTVKLGAEGMATLSVVLYLLAFHWSLLSQERSFARLAVLGVTGGILILNKSSFIPIVLLAPFMFLFISNRKRVLAMILPVVSVLLVTLTVVAPWTLRNAIVAEAFVPVQTLTGYNFWYDFSLDENRNSAFQSGSLNTIYTGDEVYLPDKHQFGPYSLSAFNDARGDAVLVKAAMGWSLDHPLGFVLKVLDNVLAFWYVLETPGKMLVGGAFSFLFLTVAGFGYNRLRAMGEGVNATFLLILVIAIVFVYAPIMAVFRYSLVTYPILSMLAAGAVMDWLQSVRGFATKLG